jgi:hypothetical protein
LRLLSQEACWLALFTLAAAVSAARAA